MLRKEVMMLDMLQSATAELASICYGVWYQCCHVMLQTRSGVAVSPGCLADQTSTRRLLLCRVFTTLEFLPFIPTQQNLDSLTAFLGASGDGATAPQANRVRLLAKLQHNVQWVAENIDAASPQSSLCSAADEMLNRGSASGVVTAG